MATAEENVERALFKRLIDNYNTLPCYFPNEDKVPPTDGLKSHVIVTHHPNGGLDYSMDASPGTFLGMGILGLRVRCPKGKGSGELRKRCGDLIAIFPKYAILVSEDIKVTVSNRPVMGSAAPTEAWYECAISVRYEVSI